MTDSGQVARRTVLAPVRRTEGHERRWAGALWVGQVDLDQVDGSEATAENDSARIELVDGLGFGRARLLVWQERQPLGFVHLEIEDGSIDAATLRDQASALPPLSPLPPATARPGVSVVVCTRDRPEHLARLLAGFATLDYPEFEVIVVDNNPASGLTPPVVEATSPVPVRVVDAVGRGLSVARNVGLRAAGYDLVAFTDDDAVIDENWLTHLVIGFQRDEQVALVCGMVPTLEIRTPAQAYFDSRTSWAARWSPAIHRLNGDTTTDELFPLRVSEFGTGANFAVRKDAVIAVGGFDEALGAGSATGGGEDIDMFLRVLLSGRLLAREPSAIVWHNHRETVSDLETQMYNYGNGLSAVMVKLLLDPRTTMLVLRRLTVGFRHLRSSTVVEQSPTDMSVPGAGTATTGPGFGHLRRRELAGVCRGPWDLLRGRLSGRTGVPLRTRTRGLRRLLDFRGTQMWGDPGNTIVQGRLASVSLWSGIVGCVAATGVLPGPLQAAAVVGFVCLGPGALLMSAGRLPDAIRWTLTPVCGIAVCTVAVSGLLMVGFWHPPLVLALLAGTTSLAALCRGSRLASKAVFA